VSVWQAMVRPVIGPYTKFVLAGLSIAVFVMTVYKLVTTRSTLPFPGVTPVWGTHPAGMTPKK
jgi:hypothetical protein